MTASAPDRPAAVFEPAIGGPVPAEVGGKARGLLAIADADLSTPPWFVVLPSAITPGRTLDADARLDPDARAEIRDAWTRLVGLDGVDRRVAVRSSAADEDARERSSAGQYRSEVPVDGLDATLAAIRRCARPLAGAAGSTYRSTGPSSSRTPPPALIVQRYVEPRAAGVAFSRDPLTGAATVVIAAARAIGGVTSGASDGDEYRAGDDGTVAVVRLERPDDGRLLDDAEVATIARAARLLERRRGCPQDLEWAIDREGRLAVLQARPITSLPAVPLPAVPLPGPAVPAAAGSPVTLWDNANIVESFPEITLPLTFSVAIELYAPVYRGLCQAVGVPPATIERETRTFEQLLGILQGRVYYNVNNWYRVLSLLPGFGRAAGFLEAMMGATRPGGRADEHAVLVVAPPASRRVRAAMTVRLGWRMLRLGRDARRFRARLADVVASHSRTPPVSTLPQSTAPASPDALLAEYERLRADALRDWRAPVLNDLCLMFVHGALRRTAERWLGPDATAMVNGLLADGGISARSGQDLLRLGAAIRARPGWSAVIRDTPAEDLRSRLARDPSLAGLAAPIDAYLGAWADRAPRELQLERPTYREDPIPLLRALRPLCDAAAEGGAHALRERRREAHRRLLWHPLGLVRVAVFSVLLRLTRRQIRWREEMRLIRGQVFGVGRRIFHELGVALHASEVLEAPEDVHYLTISELRDVGHGSLPPRRARELVTERRMRYADYTVMPRLPNRLETRGPIVDPLSIVPPVPSTAPAAHRGPGARTWRGVGAAIGRGRGPCRIVVDPARAGAAAGRIVVARSTDPGWLPILVGAAGLAVEQGSLLSHSAIVARELGIPTVTGVAGLLDQVHDGDMLELDGSTGEVWLRPTEHVA